MLDADLSEGRPGGGVEPVRVDGPEVPSVPLVLASPHSGQDYPAAFVAASRLDPQSLRLSEDCFVDELFAPCVSLGIPLIRATFPRAFVDANRQPHELDPEMFDGPLPAYATTSSPRIARGLGTIPRVVSQGREIYATKLAVGEVLARIERCHVPYHRALARLIDRTRRRFGHCLLVDCHSMPSPRRGRRQDAEGRGAVDLVVGTNYGKSCGPELARRAVGCLETLGYRVVLNVPYAGGYTTTHYGDPARGVHVVQVEIDRSLYMDERSFRRTAGFGTLAANLQSWIAALSEAAVSFR